MSKKQLTILIPEPCHENWDEMTPVEQGRFCGACQKKVVDFSNMTDKQILDVWKHNNYRMPCGRYRPEQLDRTIAAPAQRGIWAGIIKRAAALVLLVETTATTNGQQKSPPQVVTVLQEQDMKFGDGLSYVTGKLVLPNTSKPVAGQHLYIPLTDSTIITDTNGEFRLLLSDTLVTIKIKLGEKNSLSNEPTVAITTAADGRRSFTVQLEPYTLPTTFLKPEIYVQGVTPWWPQQPVTVIPTWIGYSVVYIKKSIRLPFSMKAKSGRSVMARLTNYWSGGKGK